MGKHFAVGKIRGHFVSVLIDTGSCMVTFKNRCNEDVTIADAFENDSIFSKLIKYCYGLNDRHFLKSIELDTNLGHRRMVTIPEVAILIQEYYDNILKSENLFWYPDTVEKK